MNASGSHITDGKQNGGMKMERNELPRMRSIREVAATGLMSEYALRMMEKQGTLPCIYVGRKCLINLDRLLDILNNSMGSEKAAPEPAPTSQSHRTNHLHR